MKATEYARVEPLRERPTGPYVTEPERKEALLDALRGITLGTHDLHMVDWAVRTLDDGAVRTLVSWLLRCGVRPIEDEATARRDPGEPGVPAWATGNSGAGWQPPRRPGPEGS